MHIIGARGQRIELDLVAEASPVEAIADPTRAAGLTLAAAVTMRAGRSFFDLGRQRGPVAPRPVRADPPPVAFRERDSGLLRTIHREVVIRFAPDTNERTRRALLRRRGLKTRRVNPFVEAQVVAVDSGRKLYGPDLLDVANEYVEQDEVVFATPNFVSQYRREAAPVPSPPRAQWHLRDAGGRQDVRAREAWKRTTGKSRVVVAVLDDGVDVDHPNLKGRIRKDGRAFGRDFFLPDDHPDHLNPRPKEFRYPFDQMTGNDIHGTPCAGVIVAAGNGAYGIAFDCRVLAVKIFHADAMAPDERVADAIRYSALNADILSCSWSGPTSPDVELAVQDAGRLGRRGRGAAIFCATGNGWGAPVAFPALDPGTIAVGACTDEGKLASYSNVGREVDLVAPSNGGKRGIFTTDVSTAGRGFNTGVTERGGADGLHTNDFGGTSSATPLAAGVGALVLSLNPRLNRDDLRALLCEAAAKIGRGYDRRGHSRQFGFGRVDAAKAVIAAEKS
jgi:subtilisin family serine protease